MLVEKVLLDKTGTITKGNFVVSEVKAVDISKEKLLRYAVSAEENSIHPIALAVKNYSKEKPLKVDNFLEISGQGISCQIKGKSVLLGNKKLMGNKRIEVDEIKEAGTVVYISIDGEYKEL